MAHYWVAILDTKGTSNTALPIVFAAFTGGREVLRWHSQPLYNWSLFGIWSGNPSCVLKNNRCVEAYIVYGTTLDLWRRRLKPSLIRNKKAVTIMVHEPPLIGFIFSLSKYRVPMVFMIAIFYEESRYIWANTYILNDEQDATSIRKRQVIQSIWF